MKLLKKFLIIVITLCTTLVAWAGGAVSFKTEAPMFVTMGDRFPVRFRLNAKADGDSFVAPSFSNFDQLTPPTKSHSSSISIVNGQTSKSVSNVWTVILMPQKEGTFTIGAATVVVDGKSYSTQPIAIEVRGESQQAAQPSASQSGQSQNQKSQPKEQSAQQRASNRIESQDLMLRMVLSSNSVYKGEPLRATLKLYTRVNLATVESSKVPTFNGFWSQQLDVQQGPFRETLNGKVYEAYNIASYLLYPQQDGTLTISPAEMTVIAQIVVQSSDPNSLDAFFGLAQESYSVRRALKTPEVKVQVKPFPAGAPASFAGAVGRYTMSHELSSSEVAANSALSLRLKISGSGNLNFISAPKLSMPASFEAYDVKSEEKIQNKASGSTGYRTFEYPFIARAEGDYEIAPVEFTYFDLSKKEYVTLATPTMNIKVTPDKSGSSKQPTLSLGVNREDVQQLGEDIRFIKLGDPGLRSVVAPLVFSSTYWLVILIMLLLAVLAYFVARKHIRDNRNVVLVKGKRANKVAVKRFRVAEKYMQSADRRAFYEEMLRALWGYLSDRFNLPVADLTREVVREELSRRGALAEAESIIAVIARCEEAQYSPQTSVEMSDVYDEGVEAVSKIEKVAK